MCFPRTCSRKLSAENPTLMLSTCSASGLGTCQYVGLACASVLGMYTDLVSVTISPYSSYTVVAAPISHQRM